MPTVVPAPQKQFFGVLGQRHVICISGLPNNGKMFVAQELGWYLEFFYGAKVAYFAVDEYANHGSRDENARALLDDVKSFLRKSGGNTRTTASQCHGGHRKLEWVRPVIRSFTPRLPPVDTPKIYKKEGGHPSTHQRARLPNFSPKVPYTGDIHRSRHTATNAPPEHRGTARRTCFAGDGGDKVAHEAFQLLHGTEPSES